MTEEMQQEAPALGEPTDAAVDDETAARLLSGDTPAVDSLAGADDAERTMDTPDTLGGTGGSQAGGAG